MYLSISICSESLYQEAKGFFLQQGRSDLLSKDHSSLIGAYLVTQQMLKLGKSGFSFQDGVYSYEEMYFSTSHTEDLILIAIHSKKIAVDIEYIHPRNESLLNNIHIPNSHFSQWENFYLQWCAKECLVKFLNLTGDDMNEMKIINFDPHHHFSIDEWEFQLLLTLSYKGNEYRVHADIKNGRVMALLKQSSGGTTEKDNSNDNGNYLCNMERTGMFKPID